MIILGLETSCDETAAALVRDGRHIVASTVSSQIPLHKKYSGVVPEIASRAHVDWVNSVIASVTKKTKPDVIAVTVGPGLVGSLLVGKMTAEALGWAWDLPVVGINHIEGHLLSAVLEHPALKPPFLGLVVSGGHTELLVEKKWGHTELLGRTRDDAAGEAFDKVAKMMALGYPGGPVIDRLAKKGNINKYPFPKPWLPGNWDFSFSGLKTAVLYKLREKTRWTQKEKQHLCASFQWSVVDVLVKKTLAAAIALNLKTVVVGGGVAANSLLRETLLAAGKLHNIEVFFAPKTLCTDNAAMIASCAFLKLKQLKMNTNRSSLRIQPQMTVTSFQSKPPVFKMLSY
jgi:N6-L-threonylcarbamoyladenine synthase